MLQRILTSQFKNYCFCRFVVTPLYELEHGWLLCLSSLVRVFAVGTPFIILRVQPHLGETSSRSSSRCNTVVACLRPMSAKVLAPQTIVEPTKRFQLHNSSSPLVRYSMSMTSDVHCNLAERERIAAAVSSLQQWHWRPAGSGLNCRSAVNTGSVSVRTPQ